MPRSTLLIGIASVAAVTTITTRTLAVDKTWADNGNVQWPNVSNWIPNGIPTTSDTAIFNMGVVTPPYNVVFLTAAFQPINAVIDRLRMDSSPINFTPPQSTLTIDSTDNSEALRGLVIGRLGSGTPNAVLDNLLGQLNTVYATFGVDAGSSGTLNVNGGVFSVTGTNAVWDLILGRNGTGTINVNNGSDVNVAGITVLGLSGGSGAISVNGAGSTWTNNSEMYLGWAGGGTVNITNGGALTTPLARGYGTINVTGAGSHWSGHLILNLAGALNVSNGASAGPLILQLGSEGGGSVNISSGGHLMTGSAGQPTNVEHGAGVTVTGAGSRWNHAGQLNVMSLGDVEVSAGARFELFGEVNVHSGSTITVDGSGSIWWATITNVGSAGRLTVSNGATLFGGVSILQGGTLAGNGQLSGHLVNGGVVAPGVSAGALTLGVNYTQNSSGNLQIELASGSSHDQLLVGGNAALNGALTVSLINGFVPSPGQTFTILTADDVDDTFAQVDLPKNMQVIYTPTSVILQMPATPCPADINNSGAVDVDDLIGVILAWGACPAPPTPCPADTNNSGAVDVDDLIAVILAWGACP